MWTLSNTPANTLVSILSWQGIILLIFNFWLISLIPSCRVGKLGFFHRLVELPLSLLSSNLLLYTPSLVLRFLNLFATRWILLWGLFGGVMKLERKNFIWSIGIKSASLKDWGGGDLGIKKFSPMNQAMLTKKYWRLINSPQSLLARTFKTKYHPKKSLQGHTPKARWSYS